MHFRNERYVQFVGGVVRFDTGDDVTLERVENLRAQDFGRGNFRHTRTNHKRARPDLNLIAADDVCGEFVAVIQIIAVRVVLVDKARFYFERVQIRVKIALPLKSNGFYHCLPPML